MLLHHLLHHLPASGPLPHAGAGAGGSPADTNSRAPGKIESNMVTEDLLQSPQRSEAAPMHYVHFVKYDDAVSFYDAVSDTIRRRGGNRGIFTEEGVDTVAYFGGNHGSRV